MDVVIGLTGGTGCGKSTAAAYLQKKGAYIIDADKIARKITAPGTPALAEIAASFQDVLLPDGTLNRKKLGSLVFSDAESLNKLNKITHTYIIKEIEGLLSASPRPLTVIDAPLLFECGLERLCTACIGVLASRPRRFERIMERDGLSEAEAGRRIDAQPPDAYYRARCRYIIENDGDPTAMEQTLNTILKELTL